MINNSDKHMPSMPGCEGSPDNCDRVKYVIKCLAKFISGKKIYAANHPTLAQFAQTYRDSVRDFFKAEDELVLSIDRSTIKWEDEVVYENDKREESLAFLLYRDGVGEIAISGDVPDEELDRLGGILTDESHQGTDEQDIVTRLWQEDFEFISYRVLEDYLTSELTEEELEELKEKQKSLGIDDHPENGPSLEDKGRVIIEPDDPITSLEENLRYMAKMQWPCDSEEQKEEAFQKIAVELLTVSKQELAKYHSQLRNESESESLVTFMGEVIEFTLIKGNPKAVRDVVNICQRIIDYIIEKKRIKALTGALELIREFINRDSAPEDVAVVFRGFKRQLCDKALLTSLVEEMNEHADDKDILDFLSLVGHKTIPYLCDILRKVEDKKDHQNICKALVAMAGEDLAQLFEHLDIDNAQIALDTVYILQISKLKTLSPKIKELIHYPDRRVKAEVISHLAEIDGDEAESLLFTALEDSDQTVRIRAVGALGEKNSPVARDKITSIAFSKELGHKNLEEQEAIFSALGRIGNKATLNRIEKMLRKKHLLHPSKSRETKMLAIRALDNLSEEAAVSLLEKLADDANDAVRRRAQLALKGKSTHTVTVG
jgi:hypothetical protein